MNSLLAGFVGLVLSAPSVAEPLLEGRVRLDSGELVADAQVRLFDMSDLRQGAIARATTDGTGYFALPLASLGGHALPQGFALGPNYPNPFNPSTIIPYQLAALSEVRLEVFNLLGQRLATLVDGARPAGFHTATWNATDAAGRAVGAGVYIYRMTVGAASQTGRMVLVDGQAGVAASGVASVWSGAAGSGLDGVGAQVYGLIVSGEGLVPYVDSSFRVEAGMAPVELVVSAGPYSAGKVTDDDCALCGLFGAFGDAEEEEEETTEGEDETTTDAGADGQVHIPDAKLRAAIAKELGKASGATITKAELATLTKSLRANKAGIRDLTGLESATNLRDLYLEGNTISNVSPLKNLTNLTVLQLNGNNVSDVSPLRNLTKLGYLRLSSNNVSDVSPLRNLTNLTVLQLDYNSISDVSPLRNLTKLTKLYLTGNPLNSSSINDHIPAFKRSGVAVEFDLSGQVHIPDAKLRAAIEAALGKTTGEPITKAEMTTLPVNRLRADKAGIRDLTGLESATNLRSLDLDYNSISDVSPLRNLTKLTKLYLRDNEITDISPLAGLTNLGYLGIRGQALSAASINDHIPALQRSGARVSFDPLLRESDFDIELVFLDDHFDKRDKRVIQYAARRWMSIIREDLPDYKFTQGWSGPCGDQSYAIPSGERIDDLRIYVVSFNDDDDDAPGGWASPRVLRETSHLSVVGCMGFNDGYNVSVSIALHEIGHVLGIGTRPWDNNGFVQKSPNDVHFNGPRAIAAFNDAGGRNYTGKKVPLEEDWGHWRKSVLSGELMGPSSGWGWVSAITIQALADIGYSVDVTQADSYTLPRAAAKVVAAGSTPDDRLPGRLAPQRACGVGQQREPIYVVDPQGRIVRTLHR